MKDIFSLQKEMDERLGPIIKQLNRDALAKGGYIIYRDENCVKENEFIHEYADGRRELGRMNGKPMEFEVMRVIE